MYFILSVQIFPKPVRLILENNASLFKYELHNKLYNNICHLFSYSQISTFSFKIKEFYIKKKIQQMFILTQCQHISFSVNNDFFLRNLTLKFFYRW